MNKKIILSTLASALLLSTMANAKGRKTHKQMHNAFNISSTSKTMNHCDINTTIKYTQTEQKIPTFSYNGNTSPSFWYQLSSEYATCEKGNYFTTVSKEKTHQSPINISNIKATTPNFTLNFNMNIEFEIENNGHTIELVPTEDSPKASIEIDSTIYTLQQLHMHAHSEHSIDNAFADMEIHFVFQNEDEFADSLHKYAVLGLFVNSDDNNSNNELEKVFTYNLPEKYTTNESNIIINLENLLPSNTMVYSYNGSFTTPPCTEYINWNIYATSIGLKSSDLEKFKKKYNHNYRPVTGTFE